MTRGTLATAAPADLPEPSGPAGAAAPPARFAIDRRAVIALVIALLVIWFANLDARRLIRPDEGRYAEIAREMAVTGDWITPRLNGLKYFEKPPLQYWVTAAAYRAFGADEWTARLWPGLAGALTVLVVWRFGRRLFGAEAGASAGLVAISMLWIAANAHINTLDMGLTLFLTLGLAGFMWAQRADATRAEQRDGMAIAWAGAALALLSKGLIGLVLPGGAIAIYLLITRDLSWLTRLHPIRGTAILLAIAAPWFIAVSVVNPEFPDFFFIREHFQRYLTTVHRRSEPWYYFLPLLVAGTLPWTILAVQAVIGAVRADPRGRVFRPRAFLLAWCVFVVLFFSASSSKLPSYILPVFPALAWLMGDRLVRLAPKSLAWHALPLVPLAVAAFVVSLHTDRFATQRTPAALYAEFAPWIGTAAGAMFLAAAGCIAFATLGRRMAAVTVLSVGSLVAWQLGFTGHDALAPSFSGHAIAAQVRPVIRLECPFYSVRAYDQTLPFYLGRTLTLVEFADEMAFGIEREPQLAVPSVPEFRAAWQRLSCSYAFMEPDTYDELKAGGLPMTVLARDKRRVVVANPRLTDTPLP